jgi:tetratricopeptide (TPR) repeat protein
MMLSTHAEGQPDAEKKLEEDLAMQYYNNEEYDKAIQTFEKLNKADPSNERYFNNYFTCLKKMKKYELAEKLLNKKIKKNPEAFEYYFTKAELMTEQGNEKAANEALDEPYNNLNEKNLGLAPTIANAYSNLKDYDRAMKTLERGREISGDPTAFYLELGQLYQIKRDVEKMTENYLNFIDAHPEQVQMVKNNLQPLLENENDFTIITSYLYRRSQQYPDNAVYPDVLLWIFTNRKDFYNAMIQAKALDKRLNERGDRLLNLARAAAQEQEYTTAIEAYNYIIEKGDKNVWYTTAQGEKLSTQKEQIVLMDYTKSKMDSLQNEFKQYINKYGINSQTASAVKQLAELQARYNNEVDSAIVWLKKVTDNNSIEKHIQAECKLDLGDYYLIQDNIWDSYIYYAQVDKMFKDDALGEMARFRNARLSYFNADFEWAQAQLTVLKASTSELIANDALDLSIFIQDNTGLDTVLTAMQYFAQAEMFLFQNKINETNTTLDSINTLFPNHKLADDIFYMNAKIARKQRKYDEAVQALEKIVKYYDDGILADDALYQLADIYEHKLNDLVNAKRCYEKIILDKSDSVYSVESRKRFIKLRGDKL